jgi:hypothetical protein
MVAITELMWRDPLGKALAKCLSQLYQGYAEWLTPQALEKFGIGQRNYPFIQQIYGSRPVGNDRDHLEAERVRYQEALCSKYRITSLLLPDEASIEEIKVDILLALIDEHDIASPKMLDTTDFATFRGQFVAGFSAWVARCWRPRTGYATLKHTKNWIPAGTQKIIMQANKAYYTTLEEQPPPPGEAPTLTINKLSKRRL